MRDIFFPEMDVDVEYSKTMRSALEFLSSREFDAVILDINLPDSRWPESLKSIVSKHKSLPVVCLTADPIHMKEAILLGAADYLDKSGFEKENLAKALFKAVEINHRVQRALSVKSEVETIKEEIRDATGRTDTENS